jgi:hypothetical protein
MAGQPEQPSYLVPIQKQCNDFIEGHREAEAVAAKWDKPMVELTARLQQTPENQATTQKVSEKQGKTGPTDVQQFLANMRAKWKREQSLCLVSPTQTVTPTQSHVMLAELVWFCSSKRLSSYAN